MYQNSFDMTILTSFSSLANLFAGIFAVVWIISIAVGILMIISMWQIFRKAGREGWEAIIPIYNLVILYKIVGLNPWLLLLAFIPIINVFALIILGIVLAVKLAEKFGKSGAYAAGLILVPYVFYVMLAFGSAEYIDDENVSTAKVIDTEE